MVELRSAGGISYTRQGSGEPLLLVHGLGSRKEVWNPIVAGLVDQREVIAVDLPGFGVSPLGVGPIGVREYADVVVGLIDELGLDRPHVAGNSMGGGISLEVARRGKASRVTAFAPIGFWSPLEREISGALMASFRDIGRVATPLLGSQLDRPAVRNSMFSMFYGHPTAVTHDQLVLDLDGYTVCPAFTKARRSFRQYRFERGEELAAVPVTIVWGTRDVVLYHRPQAARARRALPTARFIDLPGAGHVPFSDAPQDCITALLS